MHNVRSNPTFPLQREVTYISCDQITMPSQTFCIAFAILALSVVASASPPPCKIELPALVTAPSDLEDVANFLHIGVHTVAVANPTTLFFRNVSQDTCATFSTSMSSQWNATTARECCGFLCLGTCPAQAYTVTVRCRCARGCTFPVQYQLPTDYSRAVCDNKVYNQGDWCKINYRNVKFTATVTFTSNANAYSYVLNKPVYVRSGSTKFTVTC